MKPRTVNGRWEITVPDHIADHPFLDCHEPERFESMADYLGPHDTLFDIGAEHGCCSAVYAKLAGKVALFEPTAEFWRNIRLTWEANRLPPPVGCWPGFLTDVAAGPPRITQGWPHCATGREETGPMPYRSLTADTTTPRTSVDAWVRASHVSPSAMTIDVEGAEAAVLFGSANTIRNLRPKIWLSLHSDEMLDAHGSTKDDVFAILASHRYKVTHLATDHEEHYLCLP